MVEVDTCLSKLLNCAINMTFAIYVGFDRYTYYEMNIIKVPVLNFEFSLFDFNSMLKLKVA